MGRGDGLKEDLFYGGDLASAETTRSQFVVLPLDRAANDLIYLLQSEKRNLDTLLPDQSGEYLLGPDSSFHIYEGDKAKGEHDLILALDLAVDEKGQAGVAVRVFRKGQSRKRTSGTLSHHSSALAAVRAIRVWAKQWGGEEEYFSAKEHDIEEKINALRAKATGKSLPHGQAE